MNEIVKTHTVDADSITSGLPVGYEANATLAVALARAEIDQQIATSRALPRQISRAVSNILTLATLDEESADECVYALPRGNKPIRGPSIRLAEIIASQWGNCRVGARVVHVDRFEKYVEAEGVFHDLETNTAITSRVRRRISDRSGRVLSEDMIIVTGNAAMSIAKRNAILGGVPKAVWRKAYAAVEGIIAGDIKTLAERRDAAFKAFAAFGVSPEQIYAALDVSGSDDISLDHLTTLTGMRSAIKSGESTVEEMFPVKVDKGASNGRKSADERIDDLARGKPPHDPDTGEIKQNSDATPTAPEAASREVGEGAEPARADSAQTNKEPARAVASGAGGSAEPALAPEGGSARTEPAPVSPGTDSVGSANNSRADPARTEKVAAVPRGPKVGDDPARDEATLADIQAEAERRAAEGMESLQEYEQDLTVYEAELIGAVIGPIRRKARDADKANGGK